MKSVNLRITFGETVALVGHSGSGKSTVVQLLQRFYDPTFGSVSLPLSRNVGLIVWFIGKVTVDGVNLKDIDLSYLRKNVGVVSQEPSLFATTIAENIRYGKLDASMEEISEYN